MARTTMKTLSDRAEAMTHDKIKKIGYEIDASYYNNPFVIDHVGVSVEIQYVSKNHMVHQPKKTGLIGLVYLAEDRPTPTSLFRDERSILFYVYTPKTDKKAYMKMFDLCSALAKNTTKTIQEILANESR